MDAVSDIATNPSIPETVQANGRIVKNGTLDGIDIRVVIEPARGRDRYGVPNKCS